MYLKHKVTPSNLWWTVLLCLLVEILTSVVSIVMDDVKEVDTEC
jgi:hypothetical protein